MLKNVKLNRILALMLSAILVFPCVPVFADELVNPIDTFSTEESEANLALFLVQKIGYASGSLTSSKTKELFDAVITEQGYTDWSEYVSTNFDAEDGTLGFSPTFMSALRDKVFTYSSGAAGYMYSSGAEKDIDFAYNRLVGAYGAYANYADVIKTSGMTSDIFVAKIWGSGGNSVYPHYGGEYISNVSYVVMGAGRFNYYNSDLEQLSATTFGEGWGTGYYSKTSWDNSGYIETIPFAVLTTNNTYYSNGPQYYRFKNITRVYSTTDAITAHKNGTNLNNFYQVNNPSNNLVATNITVGILETDWSNEMTKTVSKLAKIEKMAISDSEKMAKVLGIMNQCQNYAAILEEACADSSSNVVTVTSEVPEVYTITVPKMIIMGEEATKTMTMSVVGRLAPKRVMSFIVPASVTLTEVDSFATEDIDIALSKTSLKTSDIDPVTPVDITVTLTNSEQLPGSWVGNFVVNVALDYE